MGEVKISITIVGNSGAGKTSIINRYVDDDFNGRHDKTETSDYKTVTKEFNGVKVKLIIWDTVGERYNALSFGPAQRSQGFVVVYRLNDPYTLKNVAVWDQNTPSDKPRLLVGTFADVAPHLVDDASIHTTLEGLQNANKFSANPKSLKVSSKTGENINDIFDILIKEILTNHRHLLGNEQSTVPLKNEIQDNNNNNNSNKNNKEGEGCCSLM